MKRASGILMHFSSLYNNYSIGSFGKECFEFIDFLSQSGFTYWQVLPINVPDSCNSPYKSFGAFSINPNFIDLEDLYSLNLITREDLDKARQTTPYVSEFKKLNEERFNLIIKASKNFKDLDSLNKYLSSHIEVKNFCKFMGIKKANNNLPFTSWTTFEDDKETTFAWEFSQYILYLELTKVKTYAKEKGIQLIGDIPIYVDYDSADVYYHKDLFDLDSDYTPNSIAGVPPDYFSEDGQLWGNPLYNWDKLKDTKYSWWTNRLQFLFQFFDGVRIDHFRAFESYFAIPYGSKNAKNGEWKPGPGMDFIKAIQKIDKSKLIIAEDLGVITDSVKELVDKSTFPGMRVLQFGFLGDTNSPHLPHNYINNCVAYTGTHDNNTLLGYVWELSNDNRKQLMDYIGYTNSNWDNSYDTIIRMMFMSSAGLTIFPIQDILKFGADTRMNKPGLADNNWSFRITKDQLNSINKNYYLSLNKMYGRK